MNKNKLKAFFDNRPAISKVGICKEAQMTTQWLNTALRGEIELSDEIKKRLFPVLNKYGGNF